jgi:hypothetical protein
MAKYAHIITATGIVENVSEWDGVAAYTPPPGIELRLADDNAEVGGSWNGSAFVRAPVVEPTRTQVLMNEVVQPKKFDDDGEIVDKTSDEIAAEKLELKNLLTATLVGGTDLNREETQTLLRLERE